jgi:hypothetical protein
MNIHHHFSHSRSKLLQAMDRTCVSHSPGRNPVIELPQDEFAVIDNLIDDLNKDIRNLRTLRNTKAPINRILSQDVLSYIFETLLDLATMVLDPYSNASTYPASVYISHVCTYWRETALSQPYLWTKRIPATSDGLKTFLERSKHLPITLGYKTTEKLMHLSKDEPSLASNLRRAKELYFHSLKDFEMVKSIAEALGPTSPCLEVLHMTYKRSPRRIISRGATIIPHSIDMSKLHTLNLRFGCGLDWNRVELKNLSVLKLTGNRFQVEKISVERLTFFLTHSPQLKHLELESAILDDPPQCRVPWQNQSFPMLESLILRSTGSAVAWLMLADPSSLVNLKHLNLAICVGDEETSNQLLYALFNLPHFQCPESLKIGSSRQDRLNHIVYHQSVLVDGESLQFHPHENENTLSVELSWPFEENENEEPYDMSTIWSNCLKMMKFDQLSEFDYTAEVLPSVVYWLDLFQEMSVLSRFSILSSDSMTGIIEALTPGDLPDLVSHAPTVTLPHLKDLEIRNRGESDGICYSKLRVCIELREKYGFGLKTLKLPGHAGEYIGIFNYNASCMLLGEDDYQWERLEELFVE